VTAEIRTGGVMRLPLTDVEARMAAQPTGTRLEELLYVFEVFASGALSAEVYVLEDVAGKRIAVAMRDVKVR